ncbi:peroxisomal (S)-2-hydroxy-acid oxidase GLO3 [Aedes aegypti]|uniref:(S)-2-hydroxy-acid oxidase n=1 Tax=Aedes aegypti TaxID=7159 RepID=A0A1S4F8B3_AEDAE|nr:peroxisomal (S)-2-hydroxy-acid oxidase GLO3 [Aedes aegypti]
MALASVKDYEKRASEIIPRNALDYYRSGAGDELSLRLNRVCFDRLRIRPRVLKSGSKRDLSVNLFGDRYSMPIGISPTAMQRMAHPEGEVANSKAAASRGVGFTLSTISTSSMEQVATGTPGSPKWFQLYIYRDRKLTESLVRRAEKAGFKAIVLTVDAPMFGLRRADMRNKFSLPPHLVLANFEGRLATGVQSQGGSGINEYITEQLDPTLSWDDVKWLVNFTRLPVIVKGILTQEDAVIAADMGVQGIWVSNHGARQLDSVPASIEALPEIVKAVGNRTTIVMDGGVTEGTDVFKAIALGAKMVFFGRPALWGLAVNGQQGVEHVLDLLRKELDVAMALAGCQTIGDITPNHVVHESLYAKL